MISKCNFKLLYLLIHSYLDIHWAGISKIISHIKGYCELILISRNDLLQWHQMHNYIIMQVSLMCTWVDGLSYSANEWTIERPEGTHWGSNIVEKIYIDLMAHKQSSMFVVIWLPSCRILYGIIINYLSGRLYKWVNVTSRFLFTTKADSISWTSCLSKSSYNSITKVFKSTFKKSKAFDHWLNS